MMEIYQVIHEYDEDGGFGDAIPEEDVIITFDNEDDANTFAKKYADEHVYATPYCSLYCGRLTVRKVEVLSSLSDFNIDDEKHFWWLKEG